MWNKNSFPKIFIAICSMIFLAGFIAYASTNTATYLQVAAYGKLSQAQQRKTQLEQQNISPIFIHKRQLKNKDFYEVQVGPLKTPAEVSKAKNQLTKKQIAYFQKNETVTVAKSVLLTDKIPSVSDRQSWRGQVKSIVHDNPKAKQSKPSITSPHTVVHHKEPKRLWNLRNVDIRSIIQEVSRITGKNFIIDPRVQGKISIVSSTPISNQAAYQMFLSALSVLGYAAVEHGHEVKIVPGIEAKQLATPIADAHHPGKGDEAIVRVVSIKNVSAEELVPLLRPLLPQWGNIVAYAPSNVLIISGNAANVSRVVAIIHRVDTTNTNGIDVMPLHYASAQSVVQTIKQLETGNQSQIGLGVSVAAEDQSNTILVSGPKAARLKMRILISELDTPSASGSSGNTRVIFLHFLKAKDLVPILAGIAESYGDTVGTVIGAISNQVSYTSDASEDSGANQGDGVQSLPSAHLASTQEAGAGEVKRSTIKGESDKPKIEIIGDPNTNSVIINAPPVVMRTLTSVIAQLDIRPAQVLVEALVVELNANDSKQFGIKWGTVDSTNNTGESGSSGNTSSDNIFQQGIGIITKDGLNDLQGVIKLVQQDKNADILSKPSVVVLDNHQAQIEVGQQISVLASNYPGNAGGGTVATPYNTFKQEKVALHLYVTPSISQNNTLQLAIDQGNDTLENPEDPTTTPIINISSIKTSVLVNSGNILVLGGLIQNQIAKDNNGVPILSDIPVIGALFGVHGHSKEKNMLMVFIRPVILRGPKSNLTVTNSKYNFLRREQLQWVQGQHYSHELADSVLKPWGKQLNLPTPFHLTTQP